MVGDREHAANRPPHAARAGLNPRGLGVGHLRVRDEWLRTIAETEGRAWRRTSGTSAWCRC